MLATRSDRTPEEMDDNVLENLILQAHAMMDAFGLGGMSRGARNERGQEAAKERLAFVALRGVQWALRGQGLDAELQRGPKGHLLLVGKNGQLLAAVPPGPYKPLLAPTLSNEAQREVVDFIKAAQAEVEQFIRVEQTRSDDLATLANAVWRHARALHTPPAQPRASHFPPGISME